MSGDPPNRAGVTIVIAAFEEEAALATVIGGLLRAGWRNVVVVDDGSADATSEVAHRAGAHVLRHPINRGQGAALQTGLTYALQQGAEIVVTFDADGQHRVDDIEALISPIRTGEAHAVLGSRFLDHADAVPLGRRALLRGAVWFSRVFSGAQLTDAHNGLRALSAQMVGHIDITLDRMAHASELVDQIVRSELPWREVSVRVEYTEYSRAKGQSSGAALRIAFDYLLGRILR